MNVKRYYDEYGCQVKLVEIGTERRAVLLPSVLLPKRLQRSSTDVARGTK